MTTSAFVPRGRFLLSKPKLRAAQRNPGTWDLPELGGLCPPLAFQREEAEQQSRGRSVRADRAVSSVTTTAAHIVHTTSRAVTAEA
jgi:hypothetical protein